MISLKAVSKSYTRYHSTLDRLREILTKRPHHQTFHALHPLDLDVPEGQVLGLIGNNGAGKSTLLKLITGTVTPDAGERRVEGRIGALLELGSGFHPEMTGRENVYLSGTMMGLTPAQIDNLYAEIVDFAGIEPFMDQPVKNYSSGMFMRLAFSVATCVDPDILIVDEALSVGDGAFSRKSFDRIMKFKSKGGTILFCSHSLYQVEAICDRALWLDKGEVRMDGEPAKVVMAYKRFMEVGTDSNVRASKTASKSSAAESGSLGIAPRPILTPGSAKFSQIKVSIDGESGQTLQAESLKSSLQIQMSFDSDPELPAPSIALLVSSADGRDVFSAGTHNDQIEIQRDAAGHGQATIEFAPLRLLKGEYWINVYLLCENAVHAYDQALNVASIQVKQHSMEVGLVSLPHTWQ